MDDFLTPSWIERYKILWNQNSSLTTGLRGFTALIEYGWEDGTRPSAFLHVKDGVAVSTAFGKAPAKPDFVLKATPEIWQRLREGSLSGRAALVTKKLKFKGSMITAMKYMGLLEISIALIGKV